MLEKDIDNIMTTTYNKWQQVDVHQRKENTMDERVRSGLRIPMDMNTELILRAKADGIPKNALILQILKKWLEKKKEQENI